MKLKDFDFRLWHNLSECFVEIRGGFLTANGKDEIVFEKSLIVPIDDESVEIELWSGLCDKNGKRIYEGDIIKISPKEAYIKQRLKENPFYLKGATLLVEFHIKDTFGFCFWGNEEKTGKALHPLDFWHKLYHYKEFGEDFEIEILGNIHENADLLKEKVLIKCKYSDMYDSKGFPKY
ncbi:MAG: YopX family protein [Helicobacter sp.]|uniref:YopX family protein n=1 Tax=Helicobacter sp. TaxID=218 RepID=UPI002A91B166|nr:YopX family protein [Helicobacter sp.]MDY5950918.1 YopX family protein [Helicobacter sp.]